MGWLFWACALWYFHAPGWLWVILVLLFLCSEEV